MVRFCTRGGGRDFGRGLKCECEDSTGESKDSSVKRNCTVTVSPVPRFPNLAVIPDLDLLRPEKTSWGANSLLVSRVEAQKLSLEVDGASIRLM
jgi:hypothetical protein